MNKSTATYKKFIKSIWWNAGESILYHSLLFIHHAALFSVVSSNEFGFISLTFSTIFLFTAITNFGFDDCLAPFFPFWSKSKKNCRWFIWSNLGPNYLFIIILFCFIFIGQKLIGTKFPLLKQLSHSHLLLFMLVTLLESSKKTAKNILQILFKNRLICLTELFSVFCYFAIVWSWYWTGHPLHISSLFIPLAITTSLSTATFGYTIFSWYQQLPDEKEDEAKNDTPKRIAKNRLFVFLYRMSSLPFSGNFLVWLFASFCGLSCAGTIKLATVATHTVAALLKKIFGASGNALLANLKEETIKTQQTYFSLLWSKLYQALCFLILFFLFNYKLFLLNTDQAVTQFFILCFALSLAENVTLAHERFYITQEQSQHLAIINGITTILLFALFIFADPTHPALLLFFVTLLKIGSSSFSILLSFFLWEIKPNLKIKTSHLLFSVVLATSPTFLIHKKRTLSFSSLREIIEKKIDKNL